MIEIVILAMFAGFIILRLISVFGRRPEKEETAQDRFSRTSARTPPGRTSQNGRPVPPKERPAVVEFSGDAETRAGLEEIVKTDPDFDVQAFLAGARSAYELILRGFWRGERDAFRAYVSDDVYEDFDRAIAEREKDGLSLDHKLERITQAEIVGAGLNGSMAEVTVRFESLIARDTRDENGERVEGHDGALAGKDEWTFSRNVHSEDPNWLLIETRSAE